MNFDIGDKVKCIKVPRNCGARINKIYVGGIYTVKKIEIIASCQLSVLVFEEQVNKDFIWNADCFEFYPEPQDNEFVKMMCSNERMLDI